MKTECANKGTAQHDFFEIYGRCAEKLLIAIPQGRSETYVEIKRTTPQVKAVISGYQAVPSSQTQLHARRQNNDLPPRALYANGC